MIFKPSRNAECLCGSEKKYKFCCIGKLPENIENYYGLLQKEGIIKNKLMRWFSENLTEEEIGKLQKEIEKYRIEGDLRREIQSNIKRLQEIGSYRGQRHAKNLPVRGQRTRVNARTKRGKRITIGTVRKEVAVKMGATK